MWMVDDRRRAEARPHGGIRRRHAGGGAREGAQARGASLADLAGQHQDRAKRDGSGQILDDPPRELLACCARICTGLYAVALHRRHRRASGRLSAILAGAQRALIPARPPLHDRGPYRRRQFPYHPADGSRASPKRAPRYWNCSRRSTSSSQNTTAPSPASTTTASSARRISSSCSGRRSSRFSRK